MTRRAFYSFHYANDNWRASQVRNIGVIEGNRPASANEWEEIERGGIPAIKRWIDGQMRGKSVVIVLVGAETAGRPWIEYEIQKGWNDGKGVLGVCVHGLKDRHGNTSYPGANPFSDFVVADGKLQRQSVIHNALTAESLDEVAEVHNPTFLAWDSKDVYANIRENLAGWIEHAIEIRANYLR